MLIDAQGVCSSKRPSYREIKICPVCGKENPDEFFFNDYLEDYCGCSDCMSKTEWGDYIA